MNSENGSKGKKGFYQKVSDGLVSFIFDNEEPQRFIDLRDNRAVGIRIEKLNKSFGSNHVLKDVSMEIFPGETFSIIGPSGTGKSVLLKLIVRLDTP
ncbi:MAG: ATP-binding cassette domain-containing protein, partial [Deltaproteobacteria bacterium]